ncbi:2-isopropylmalate synthase [Shouchella sp. JSM 1781072]|uniref:2-isopropylmalate synthase n=1 Tax=Bacillaceae TaxID=186817 RepID=UPI0020D0365F|nr:2-isopropylmalate synthase [Alkalihalobacillus sp. LMS6]UTR05118.1 2-isopropylmalate synthase [Alkalihalobacillus sp. LMS6]
MGKVNIFDTTLRDGEQSPGINLNHREKLDIAFQLERLGVDIIEAGFPASSKGDFQSVKEIATQIKASSVTGLARSKESDIDACWEALKASAEPRIHVFLATSPIHMQYKLKLTPEQVIEQAVESVKYAAKRFPHVQFSAEDASRSDWGFLAKIIEATIDAGASVINLPDTVGYTMPKEISELFEYISQTVPNIDRAILSTHNHDDLGMGVANSLAAIQGGARQVECTINGIGERAGNASLEEIAVGLHIRSDYYETGTNIQLNELKRTSALVSRYTSMPIPKNKAVVGSNAFAHESGIHQDGMLKHKETYEIITPELVGATSSNPLGKHSGRHAFQEKMKALGFKGSSEELITLFNAFKTLADKKKMVTEDDLYALMIDQGDEDQEHQYKLEALQVSYGTNQTPTATIKLKHVKGSEYTEASTGSGSVEAIYNTLAKLTDFHYRLKDYRIQSITEGEDALAEVHVNLSKNDRSHSGRGVANDVLEASAKAYIHAVNRFSHEEKRLQEPSTSTVG